MKTREFVLRNVSGTIDRLLFTFLLFWGSQIGFANVVINEIMYHPGTLRAEDEFIELYNSGSEAVDLSGWKFSNGVVYTFPQQILLAANSFLLVSPSPDDFRKLYGELPVVGPYTGKLNNDGETLELVDSTGREIDKVKYKDEEGWPKTADGEGPSIELLNPEMPSSQFQSWAAGPKGGSPGKPNSVLLAKPFPVVTNLSQSPVLPKSSEPVHIAVEVKHHKSIRQIHLYYKNEIEATYRSIPMLDDGQHGDGASQDEIYGADIPSHADGSIVEFYVEAQDSDSVSGTLPLTPAARPLFYLVDDSAYPSNGLPLYRIVMRGKDDAELRTRDRFSNIFLPATFICENEIYHDVDIRFRGKGARGVEPKSYRIDFTSTRHFGNTRKLNLNGRSPIQQFIGLEAFKRVGMPASGHPLVSIVFNRTYVPKYVHVERLDKDMLAHTYADPSGNFYRCMEHADLIYLGDDKENYRAYYEKMTNQLEDDYSDIFRLCDAFSNLTDDAFPQDIGKQINTIQWIRYLALRQVLNDTEGGLHKERGDEYYTYHNPTTGVFELLPWDLECVLDPNYSPPHHHLLKAVQRLLRHPDLARFYYQQLLSLIDNELSPDVMANIIEQTAPLTTAEERAKFLTTYKKLCELNRQNIPQDLTVVYSPAGSQEGKVLIPERSTWKFHRGETEPAGNYLDWTKQTYDDSQWESGKTVLGYGEAYIDTVLNDMEDNYWTLFARYSFEIPSGLKLGTVTLNVMYDDGFVAYLNGVEVARQYMDGDPAFSSQATSSHEADNAFHEFTVNPAALVPGKNVLAIVMANISLNSSDLVLDARLTAETLDDSKGSFSGLANAALTRFVQVNKQPAIYTPWTGKWSFSTALAEGRNEFSIEALSASSEVVDSTTIVVYQGTPPVVNSERVITLDRSPYSLDGTIVVGATETLKIEAGVTLQFPKSAGIVVYGTLTVDGSEQNPVTMKPLPGVSSWGGIGVDKAVGKVEIRYATFEAGHGFSYENETFSGAVYVKESTATVERCTFNNQCTTGIGGLNSYIVLRHNTFGQSGEAVAFYTCSSLIEYNRFLPITGYNDAIDFDGDRPPLSIIRYNHFMGSEDDALDMGDASPLIEGNLIENSRGGKGLSLEGKSTPKAINNVIRNCDIGIAIKDQCNTLVINNTIVDCTTGVSLYQKNAGRGGGFGTIVNCVIWNVKETIVVDSLSPVAALSNDLMDLKNAPDHSNFSKDPKFDSSSLYVYFPAKGSPLIDAGREEGIILTDYRGEPRPKGLALDIGAYETDYATSVENWMMQ